MLQEFSAFERLPVTVTEADLLRDIQIHLPVNESDFLQSRQQIRGARNHRPGRSFELETHGVLGGWGKTLRNSEDALLKKITVANYRQDPYYARIVKRLRVFFGKRDSLLRWNSLFVWICFPRNRWRNGGAAGLRISRWSYAAI
jgi:hypothetical protein